MKDEPKTEIHKPENAAESELSGMSCSTKSFVVLERCYGIWWETSNPFAKREDAIEWKKKHIDRMKKHGKTSDAYCVKPSDQEPCSFQPKP